MPHIHELFDFTTSGFVIHPTKPKLLLLKHKKIGKWLQPGGHVELNENPLQTLHHEFEEETGLTPEDYEIIEPAEQPSGNYNNEGEALLPLPFHMNVHNFKNGPHRHIDICYLMKSKTSTLTDNPDGASDIKWLDKDEIEALYQQGDMFDSTYDILVWIFDTHLKEKM